METDGQTRRGLLRRIAAGGSLLAVSSLAGCQGNDAPDTRETVEPPPEQPTGQSPPLFPTTRERTPEKSDPVGGVGGAELTITSRRGGRAANPMVSKRVATNTGGLAVDFRALDRTQRRERRAAFARTDRDWRAWLETIPDEETFVRSRELGVFLFERPTGPDGERYEQFDAAAFAGAASALEALDHLHSYMLAFAALGTDQQVSGDSGYRDPAVAPQPADSITFAPVLEAALSRYTSLDVTFWPVPMYERKQGGTYTFPRFVQRGGLYDVERVPFARRSENNRYWAMMGYDHTTGETLLVDGIYRPEWFNRQHYRYSRVRLNSGEWPDALYAHELLAAIKERRRVDSAGRFGESPVEMDVRPRSTHNPVSASPYVPTFEHLEGDLRAINDQRRERCETDACRAREFTELAVVDQVRTLQTLSAATDYWAPPRYTGRPPAVEGLDHRTAVELVLAAFVYQVGSPLGGRVPEMTVEAGVVPDRQYVESVARQWRGQEQYVSHEQAREQAWILKTLADQSGYYRIRGTLATPSVLEVDSAGYERVWRQYK